MAASRTLSCFARLPAKGLLRSIVPVLNVNTNRQLTYCRLSRLYTIVAKKTKGLDLKQLTCNISQDRKYALKASVDFADEPDVLYKKIVLEIKGHDTEVLNSYTRYIQTAASLLQIPHDRVIEPPKIIQREILLKSVHIYSKHKVEYERRTHFKILELKELTGSTAEVYLEYIQRNLPEGIAMKVTRVRLEELPDSIAESTQQQEPMKELTEGDSN